MLGTAGLKLYGLRVTAIPPVGWFSTPWLQFAAVEWEVALGLWLLSGWLPVAAWFATGATFLLFAGISGSLGWTGQADCGCFGIKASPWYAFAVDVAALAALALARPRPNADQLGESWHRKLRPVAALALGVAVLFSAALVAATAMYGSVQGAVVRLQGKAVTAGSAYVDFGVGRPGQKLAASVEVTNWSDEPVRLIGGTSDCSCVLIDSLPIALAPGQAVVFPIRFRVPAADGGRFTRTAYLLTDNPRQPKVRLHVSCTIDQAAAEAPPARPAGGEPVAGVR